MAVENTQSQFGRRTYLQNTRHRYVKSREERLIRETKSTAYTRTVKIFEGYTSGYAILNDCGRTNVVHVLYRSSAHESPSYATLKDDFLEDIRSHWQNLGFGFVSL
jgi:hypothetical protein